MSLSLCLCLSAILSFSHFPLPFLSACPVCVCVCHVALPSDNPPLQTSVLDAFHTLSKHHISSAPVLDTDTGEYIGLVDMFDMVAYCVKVHTVAESAGSSLSTYFTSVRNLIAASTILSPSAAVLDLVNLSRNNPFVAMKQSAPVLDAFTALAGAGQGKPAVHRVMVVADDSNDIVGLITQSDVVAFLKSKLSELGPVVGHTLPTKPHVVTVGDEDPVMKAFELMVKHKVTGLPVVDSSTGHVLNAITTSDVRLMVSSSLDSDTGLIGKTVMEFIQAVRLAQDAARGDGATMGPLSALPDTASYWDAIEKLAVTHRHRVFVERADGTLCGVVSLKDIIARLVVPPHKLHEEPSAGAGAGAGAAGK